MRLATIRTATSTAAVRVVGEEAIEIGALDVGTLLVDPGWRARAEAASGHRHEVSALDVAPLIPRPEKIICVGLNYKNHILEMGRELPEHPTLFAKFPSALIGARDDIVLPRVSSQVDWEVELAVVIGAPARHVSIDEAPRSIAGYSVLNDVSVRDWQNRTLQWLQGKTFESSTPLGPELVTLDELADAESVHVRYLHADAWRCDRHRHSRRRRPRATPSALPPGRVGCRDAHRWRRRVPQSLRGGIRLSGRPVDDHATQVSSCSWRSRAIGHAPAAVFEITVCVIWRFRSCTLRNDTPASQPSSSTTPDASRNQNPSP